MKKILVAAFMLLALATYASSGGGKKGNETEKGNHVAASQIPGRILSQFNAAFPGATNVSWEVESEHGSLEFKAQFFLSGKKMKVRYR